MKCIYCKHDLGDFDEQTRLIPKTENDWAEEAHLHAAWCEWVITRAHTRDQNSDGQ